MSWDQTKLLRQKLKQGVVRAEKDIVNPSDLFPTIHPEENSPHTSGSSASQREWDTSVPGTFFCLRDGNLQAFVLTWNLLIFNL